MMPVRTMPKKNDFSFFEERIFKKLLVFSIHNQKSAPGGENKAMAANEAPSGEASQPALH